MDQQIKILVAGSVCGNFKRFFKRLDDINKKSGPFEIALCVGNFFSAEQHENNELIDFQNGTKKIAIPTFILGPTNEILQEFYKVDENQEFCHNLTYLGKHGMYTLQSGIRIVYVSGVEMKDELSCGKNTDDTNSNSNSMDYYFTKDDILTVRNLCITHSRYEYRGIDVLLTSEGPYGINGDDKNMENLSTLITYLCKEIKPRYHFYGFTKKYAEFGPFRLPADNITQLQLSVRIVGLAPVVNTLKEKYIFALSLMPTQKMRVQDLIQKTTNEEPWPSKMLTVSNELNMQNKEDKIEQCQYFFDVSADYNKGVHSRSEANANLPNKKAKFNHINQDICWFCLSSPDVEKHLIITIGKYFYLALAKGPINDYHVLILSVRHIQAASLLSNNEEWQELLKFKESLRQFFKAQNQIICFTERNYKSSHLQINCLGTNANYLQKIVHTFEDKAEEYNLDFESLDNLKTPDMLPSKGPYFVAELPNGNVLITKQMKRFPLHFAREVFCNENVLNCDEKIDWRDCKLDKETEIEYVKQFREKYDKYSWTT